VVASTVAHLDTGDPTLWSRVDPVVARIVDEAYGMTSTLTGLPRRHHLSRVPPPDRVRELTAAQRALLSELDRCGMPVTAHGSVHLLCALHSRLPQG
jgi:hypothetical protein